MIKTKNIEHDKICAIVISYFPDDSFSKNIDLLSKQTKFIYIIDNSNDRNVCSYLDKIVVSNKNVKLIINSKNLGIAKALNIGILEAINDSFEWALTMDQDSSITEDYVINMINAFSKIDEKCTMAILGPVFLNRANSQKISFKEKNIFSPNKDGNDDFIYKVKNTMTSGNIVNVNIIKEIGLFDEDLFIDFVDNELCLRCRKNGFNIFETSKSILLHDLGKCTVHSFLGIKNVTVTNHSALRRYYKYRNRIHLYKKYFWFDSSWVASDLFYFFWELITISLYENDRRKKATSIFIGIVHGIFGVTGEFKNEGI